MRNKLKTQAGCGKRNSGWTYLGLSSMCSVRFVTTQNHDSNQSFMWFNFSRDALPCIWSAGGKFELTNQDSAGGKNFTVLTSMKVCRKGIEDRQLFSLEMALNIHEKGFTIVKTLSVLKMWKIWRSLCLQASNLAPDLSRRRPAWQLARSSSSVAR